MTAKMPSRDDAATMTCPVCDRRFQPSGRKRYCGDACRRRAWARRHQREPVPVVVPPLARPRRPVTVYECEACGFRALGVQRCEECGGFMSRVGLGGLCPNCNAAVAAAELIEVVEDSGRGRR